MEKNTGRNNAYLYRDVLNNTAFSVPEHLHLPYSDDFSQLAKSKSVKNFEVKNRICYQPMEAQDSDELGNPTEKTFRRYNELAEGGAGIIWLEAVSVIPEGRSNLHQLLINKNNLDSYKKLVEQIKTSCLEKNGYEPCVIIQLNHSGRHSKPNGKPEPLVAMDNEYLNIYKNAESKIISDEYADTLADMFAKNAILSEKAGFDGVDIKCCHGYLLSEMLAAYDRPGRYGGDFFGRIKLFADSFKAANGVLSSKTIRTARLNIYDGYDSKYSFGRDTENYKKYDLSEPKRLIQILIDNGLDLLNVTMGSPYINPDVSRPYRPGVDKPKTNALEALARLFNGANEIHKFFPCLPIINTGVSGLVSKSAYAAAGMIEEDMTDFVGFGRMNFAYPNLAHDILCGKYDEKKCCVACSGCSTLKKNGLESGCIIRNDYYKKIFREFMKK